MGYNEFILSVNVISVVILLMMGLLLCFAARFKGESSYAVFITVLTTIPIYLYNICRCIEWNDMAIFLAPLGYSANLALMPLLYLLVHRGFNPFYRFTFTGLLHFIPAFLFFAIISIYLFLLPANEYPHFIAIENIGRGSWVSNVNYLILLIQLGCYLFVIFRYLRRVKHYICDHYSDSELLRKVWIPRFILLFAVLFIVAMSSYAIWPRTYAWLNQLLNVVTIGYLLYSELAIAFSERYHAVTITAAIAAEAEADFITTEVHPPLPESNNGKKEDAQLLNQYARQIDAYLATSEAYINPNLSLKDVAMEMGISSKNLSKAINSILGRNFFDLINSYRIEKSKRLLLSKKEKGLTLETIAEQCGFNSRFTFNIAFKKATGFTTSEWLKNYSKPI